jgi:hypothetical protein
MKNLVVFLALSICAMAQSPLKTIGKFTCYQQFSNGMTRVTGAGPAAIKNISRQTIIAVVLKIDASCGTVGTRMTYVHDMIFKATGLSRGTKLQMPVDVDEAYSSPVDFQSGTLTITPLFVQFEDGSTWGDAAYIQDFTANRADAVAWVNSLLGMDDKSFVAALNTPINSEGDTRPIQGHLKTMVQQDGVGAAKAMISERLKTYNERIANGHF